MSNKEEIQDEEIYDEDENNEDDNFDDYYNNSDFDYELSEQINEDLQEDPEHFEYRCLNGVEVHEYFAKSVDEVCKHLRVSASVSKILLLNNNWDAEQISLAFTKNKQQLFAASNLSSSLLTWNNNSPTQINNNDDKDQAQLYATYARDANCNICVQAMPRKRMQSLSCGHAFCVECWRMHINVRLASGVALRIECMERNCQCPLLDDLAKMLLEPGSTDQLRYEKIALTECVAANPYMQQCTGPDCDTLFLAKKPMAKRVQCSKCGANCCFKCQLEYHAPTDCQTIRQWLSKCRDDSETANYISAHTKDCPKCNVCIEKNGGCNHMQCTSCKYNFCWICLGDWKTHGSDYYECSRFKEGVTNAKTSKQSNLQAREALKKYLFYYERWENHARSLRLEEQTFAAIKQRVQEKVMQESASGATWIDWQYLLDAATLLAKCRYTLQYTYPYVYFMENGPRKQLFEYQQAQLEAEIEALSWKVERSDTYDRAEMENQMDVAEKRRSTLLKDFLPV